MPLIRVLEPEVMSSAEEAREYDAADFSATDQLFAERAAHLAKPAGIVLDIGSGNAKIPLAMCALLPAGRTVIAAEMSWEMLAVAARNRARAGGGPAWLVLVNADAKQLPFADGSLTMITSNSLVHHLADPSTLFREIARVAHPGAPILIRDLIRPDDEAQLAHLLEVHGTHWTPLQRNLFSDSLRAALTLAEVRSFLNDSGLSDVQLTQTTDRHWSAERVLPTSPNP